LGKQRGEEKPVSQARTHLSLSTQVEQAAL
jgi:hypothetical protein